MSEYVWFVNGASSVFKTGFSFIQKFLVLRLILCKMMDVSSFSQLSKKRMPLQLSQHSQSVLFLEHCHRHLACLPSLRFCSKNHTECQCLVDPIIVFLLPWRCQHLRIYFFMLVIAASTSDFDTCGVEVTGLWFSGRSSSTDWSVTVRGLHKSRTCSNHLSFTYRLSVNNFLCWSGIWLLSNYLPNFFNYCFAIFCLCDFSICRHNYSL